MLMCHSQYFCTFNVTNTILQTPSGLCSEDVKKHLNLVHICGKKLPKYTCIINLNPLQLSVSVDENVFDHKTNGKSDAAFHKIWTPFRKMSKIGTTTTTQSSIDSSADTNHNAMSDGTVHTVVLYVQCLLKKDWSFSAAAFFPPSHVENVHPRINNDTNLEILFADTQCSNFRWRSESQSCIPIYVPNFISIVYFIIATTLHLKGGVFFYDTFKNYINLIHFHYCRK